MSSPGHRGAFSAASRPPLLHQLFGFPRPRRLPLDRLRRLWKLCPFVLRLGIAILGLAWSWRRRSPGIAGGAAVHGCPFPGLVLLVTRLTGKATSIELTLAYTPPRRPGRSPAAPRPRSTSTSDLRCRPPWHLGTGGTIESQLALDPRPRAVGFPAPPATPTLKGPRLIEVAHLDRGVDSYRSGPHRLPRAQPVACAMAGPLDEADRRSYDTLPEPTGSLTRLLPRRRSTGRCPEPRSVQRP